MSRTSITPTGPSANSAPPLGTAASTRLGEQPYTPTPTPKQSARATSTVPPEPPFDTSNAAPVTTTAGSTYATTYYTFDLRGNTVNRVNQNGNVTPNTTLFSLVPCIIDQEKSDATSALGENMVTITLPPELELAVTEKARLEGTTPEIFTLDTLCSLFIPEIALPEPHAGSLADFLGDYIGCLDSGEIVSGGAKMSENVSEKFTEGLLQKRREGKL